MSGRNTVAVVLAAGLGKRMKSKTIKVLHSVLGRPMLLWTVAAARAAGINRIVTVVGQKRAEVARVLGDTVEYMEQSTPLGTGHAVMQTAPLLATAEADVLVLYGDTPLLMPGTIAALLEAHRAAGAAATVLTARVPDPAGYGRIQRDATGGLAGIVEDADATPEQKKIDEINTGIYVFSPAALYPALQKLKPANAQGEYYLTDVIGILKQDGFAVQAVEAASPAEVLGVNDRRQLAEAARILRERILASHMDNGVTIVDPASTFIGPDVAIEPDATIEPFSVLEGRSSIGEGAVIGPGSYLRDTAVGPGARVVYSYIEESEIGPDCSVGPYAHLRPGSVLEEGAKVGNFAEIKNTRVGRHAKIPHHSYVGDATIGQRVNVGAGVVFVNYDGVNKHHTDVEDDAFLGCNTNLVAPVRVGREAYTAAGSTINEDVPDGALAIARARQVNKEGYVARLKARYQAQAKNAGGREEVNQ